MKHRFAPLFLVCTLASSAFAGKEPHYAEWPEWRGPGGQGQAVAKDLPATWSESSGVAWKALIPGRGWSSPVIDGKQIWLTTAIETPAKPEEVARRLKADTGNQPLTVLEKVELRAVCVDRGTGGILHDVPLLTVSDPQWVHQLNSYASPTPVIEGGRLYCHFGTFGTVCVDTAKGAVLWKNTGLHIMHENGPGSSPVLWRNLLIFHMDGSDVQFIAALDKATGSLVWKTARSGKMEDNPQLKKSYGTPIFIQSGGKAVLISTAANWLYAYDPADGRELWKIAYGKLGFSHSARPVAGHGMVFMSTAFMKPEMLAIRTEGPRAPEIAWRYAKGAPNMPSPLLVGDELYIVSDGGFLTCLDAKTGAENYRERLGGDYSSSPIFADGKIYIGSRTGLVTVFKPGKKFEVLGKNQLPGKIMATPAAVDGALFIRTDEALWRIGIGAKP